MTGSDQISPDDPWSDPERIAAIHNFGIPGVAIWENGRSTRLPLFTTLILVICLFIFMCVFQTLWKRKYIVYARQLDIKQSADRVLIRLLRNFQFSRVEQHKFRGIQAKQCTVKVGFEDLGTSLLPPKGVMKFVKNGPAEKKPVLKGVCGQFHPHRLSAIMGPSGAGKTTFLNVLCGKTTTGSEWEVYGKVMVNDAEADIRDLKTVMGFVPQEDIVHEHMTVRENIRFSAVLRNPRGSSRGRIKRITEDVLQVLQLVPNQNVQVGNRTRGGGLSGGQRKRVNVGMELAACPTLLFLDEPTSGLDATSSLLLVKQLRKMAKLGMTIVMVVHQPRYSLFTLIDDVLLLGKGGSTVYIGPTTEAKGYFERLGFIMPPNENAADWMMDMMSGQVEDHLTRIPKAELPEALFDAWERAPEAATVNRTPPRRGNSGSWTDEDHKVGEELIKHHIKENWRKFAPDGGKLAMEEFGALLKSCTGEQGAPPAEVVQELVERIQGKDEVEVSQQKLILFLLDYQGLMKQNTQLAEIVEEIVEWERAGSPVTDSESERSSDSESSDDSDSEGEASPIAPLGRPSSARIGRTRTVRDSLHRRLPGFFYQLRVEMHRRSLVWWRNMTLLILFLGVVFIAGVVLGTFDRYVFKTPKWFPPSFLNAHISLGLLTAVYTLRTFSEDQPIFWRESSHGLNRLSFMLGRIIVNTVDWFMMCYMFTGIYFLISEPEINYFAWVIPDLLVAWVASGWGYLIACFLPPELGSFVAAVSIFVLGGILGLPDKMGIFLDGGIMECAISMLSFTRWSVAMSFLSYTNEFRPNAAGLDPLESAQLYGIRGFYYQSHWNLPGGEREVSYWRTGMLALILMGTVLRIGAYVGLVVMNRDKQK